MIRDRGILLFQKSSGAGDRAASSQPGNKVRDLSFSLSHTSGPVVR